MNLFEAVIATVGPLCRVRIHQFLVTHSLRVSRKEGTKTNLQFTVAGGPPAGAACTASIRSQRGNITASARAEAEKQTRPTWTRRGV